MKLGVHFILKHQKFCFSSNISENHQWKRPFPIRHHQCRQMDEIKRLPLNRTPPGENFLSPLSLGPASGFQEGHRKTSGASASAAELRATALTGSSSSGQEVSVCLAGRELTSFQMTDLVQRRGVRQTDMWKTRQQCLFDSASHTHHCWLEEGLLSIRITTPGRERVNSHVFQMQTVSEKIFQGFSSETPINNFNI